ncbi:MAG: ABC transporter ATP-binding protein [Coprobacillaceae bacterium]
MSQHTLSANNVVAGYDKKEILHGLQVHIPDHKVSVIIGSNACGKSTLLKTFARLLMPTKGEVVLDGKKIHQIPSKKLAQTLGLLPQSPIAPEGIRVSDLVARGRFPYHGFMGGMKEEDYKAVSAALEVMGITDLADRGVDELSGGQRQRVWIAMALAQQTDILFLDEPTTFLDLTHQIEILDILRELNEKMGTTIVMVLHDINLSARYSDHIIALKDGKLIAEGEPCTIINEELINTVFNLECSIINDPISNTPLIIPKGKYKRND